MKRCCAECFGDRGLRKILPTLSPEPGDCSYCETSDTTVVDPAALLPLFEMLIDIYIQDPDGQPLVKLLRDDWGLFSHTKMDNAHAKDLLGEILDDGEIVRKNFSPRPEYSGNNLSQWEVLRDEIMHQNRWFLGRPIDLVRLKDLLDYLIAPELETVWYRARMLADENILEIKNMGAPPRHLAGHGRANPAGIPYLYLGSMPETAIAELRPHTGDVACVADFTIPSIRAVDLRNPRQHISPFFLSDMESIGQLRVDIPLLERLGSELTRPVLPRGAAYEYIPTQYLCEFIKNCGFEGVLYRSSVSPAGINLALFNPMIATGGSASRFSVDRVRVDVTEAVLAV